MTAMTVSLWRADENVPEKRRPSCLSITSVKATLASARQYVDPIEAEALSKLGAQYSALYRTEEYAKAGVPMLPVTHGKAYTGLQVLLYTLILLGVSLLPFVVRMSGWLYLCAALVSRGWSACCPG